MLAGVNDDLGTMKTLVHKLLMCRVRPYYIYQCDLINGSSHLRTSVAKGIEIIEGLRGHTTGYAVPQFVIDAPGGGGKVPINPGYVLYHDNEKIVIRNYEGKIFEYPETGNEQVQFAPQREYHDEYLSYCSHPLVFERSEQGRLGEGASGSERKAVKYRDDSGD